MIDRTMAERYLTPDRSGDVRHRRELVQKGVVVGVEDVEDVLGG